MIYLRSYEVFQCSEHDLIVELTPFPLLDVGPDRMRGIYYGPNFRNGDFFRVRLEVFLQFSLYRRYEVGEFARDFVGLRGVSA